ncbi:hypothetical protein [Nocardia sp. NPDC052566]|uniref:hypothetical protein n=1 Tax=Nocardia sp. NPDC052566 TaxID=3364330 RepID=UPI0037CA674F
MSSSEMVRAEGYWVSSDPQRHVSFELPETRVSGHGSPGVRYVTEGEHAGLVWLTLGGHHAGGRMPLLIMNLDAAAELAQLLAAAVNEGRIIEGADLPSIPFRDVTGDRCNCPACDDALVALLEAEAGQ